LKLLIERSMEELEIQFQPLEFFVNKVKTLTVNSCKIEHHSEGGILLDLDSESIVKLKKNEIRGCEIAAIYVEGYDS
jgi:hypothetical protein